MAPPNRLLALGLPSNGELIVILVIGLLLFGRRLPEVGRAVGRTLTEFRRGLNSLKHEIDSDRSLRDAKAGLDDLKRVVAAPKALADPRRLFEQLTETERSSSASSVDQEGPNVATIDGKPPTDRTDQR